MSFLPSGKKAICMPSNIKKKNGNMQVAANYVCSDGFRLKTWLNNQAYKNKNGKLSEEQKEKLELIGCF